MLVSGGPSQVDLAKTAAVDARSIQLVSHHLADLMAARMYRYDNPSA